MTQTVYQVKFSQMLNAVEKEYIKHFPIKKDSWRDMSINEIQLLVVDVYNKWYARVLVNNTINHSDKNSVKLEFDEVVDLSNLLNMLGQLMIYKFKGIEGLK